MDYVDVPKKITEEAIISEYGEAALRFYKSRIEERRMQGKVYLNPLKTIYIWAAQDRKTHQGFYTTWNGFNKSYKSKNHGRS